MEKEENNHQDGEADPCEICKKKGRLKFVKVELPEEDWTFDTSEV